MTSPDRTAADRWLPATSIVRLGLLGALLQIFGGAWDISWHVDRGRDTFFSPPHLVLYAGILLVLAAASLGLTAAAASGVGWQRRLRSAPVVAAIGAATVFQLSSAPIDEFWHQTFGRDVSVWSPPHLMLIVGAATTFYALAALQLRRMKAGVARGEDTPWWEHLTLLLLVACGGAMLLGIVIENDFPGIPAWHPSQQRPAWVYPAIVSAFGAFGLAVAARTGRAPWPATVTSLLLMGIRLATIGLLLALGRTMPYPPLLLVAGGVVLDLLLHRRIARPGPLRLVVAGSAFAAALWGVSLGWSLLTGLPAPRPDTLLATSWLLLPLSIVGVGTGVLFAAGLDWISEPRPMPAEPARAPGVDTRAGAPAL